MKTYLVEFENLVTNDPVIVVFNGETEESVWNMAMEYSRGNSFVSEYNFDMYPVYRNCEGALYLGGVE